MDLKDVLAWVDTRLKALGLSDRQAEGKAGTPSLIQNMRKTIRNGHGSLPKVPSLRKLGKVLGDEPPGLYEPLAPLNGKPVPESTDDAIAHLVEQQAHYRDQERKFKALADAIDVSLSILQRKQAS
jgi:hypothetical protein